MFRISNSCALPYLTFSDQSLCLGSIILSSMTLKPYVLCQYIFSSGFLVFANLDFLLGIENQDYVINQSFILIIYFKI